MGRIAAFAVLISVTYAFAGNLRDLNSDPGYSRRDSVISSPPADQPPAEKNPYREQAVKPLQRGEIPNAVLQSPQYQAAKAKVDESTIAQKSAKDATLSTLGNTVAYQSAKADKDQKGDALAIARRGDDIQAKLQASHDFVVAKQRVDLMEGSALKADPAYVKASQSLADAAGALKDVTEDGIASYQHKIDVQQNRSNELAATYDTKIYGELKTGLKGRIMVPVVIIQVTEKDKMLVRLGEDGDWAFLKGWPTDGLVDDKAVNLSDTLIEVTGTETYTTVMGAGKTVYVVEKLKDQ